MKEDYSLVNNRDVLFSKTLFTLSILGYVIYFIVLFVSIYLTLVLDTYLTVTGRTLLVAIGFIPIVIFNYCFFSYENLYPNNKYSWPTTGKIFVFFIYLFIPTILILFRYKNFVNNTIIFFGVISFILNIISPLISKKTSSFRINKFIIDVTIRTWSKNLNPINTAYFDNKKSSSSRKVQYFHKKNLEVFQSNFLRYSEESKLIVGFLNDHFSSKADDLGLEVLDIGGHNGEFTGQLLGNLNQNVSYLEMIDPIINPEYKINVDNRCDISKIVQMKFEDFQINNENKFDLIIANHSLYSYIDFANGTEKIEGLINQLSKILKTNGIFFLTFGSEHSPAYSLKNDIIDFLMNDQAVDVNAEVVESLIKNSRQIYCKSLEMDNYIGIDDLLSNTEELNSWVSYFARVPRINDSYMLDQIRKIFLYYSISKKHLPICAMKNAHNNELFLIHKTKAIFVAK